MWQRSIWIFLVLIAANLLCRWCEAQQNPPGSNAPPPPGQQASANAKSEAEKEIERKEQSQRALGVLPAFIVTNRWNASPLTPGQKFHLFVKSSFDPATIGTVALQAAVSQAVNEFPGYGQGMQGYGKRFGASLADEVSDNFWSGYVFPVIFKEDPRYFRLGKDGFRRRLFNAAEQEFVCRTDKGRRSFGYSNVLGALVSGSISNIYYPGESRIRTVPATATSPAMPVYEDDRGIVLTLTRTAVALAYDMAGNAFLEFAPDVRRMFSHKRKRGAEASGGAKP